MFTTPREFRTRDVLLVGSRWRWLAQGVVLLCWVFNLSARLIADERAALEHFEKAIRPVLIEQCYDCHSAAAKEVKGGLLLDTRDGWKVGGESGPAVVSGKPADSLLLSALRHEGIAMPPKKKLPDRVIRDFEQWIASGAVDPRDQPATPEQAGDLARQAQYDQRRDWWSLKSLRAGEPPSVHRSDWPANRVDRFLLARLEQYALSPSTPADRTTLARRLSFALRGLPPAPSEVDEFLADDRPDAWERLTDRWLASPHFGEHWARHWMDVVRYTDTYGYEWDVPAKGAWRYRDYLTRAFNADLPFDQLVREQIAGDLLPEPRINPLDQVNESLIGPMFYQMGEKRHGDSSEFDGIHQEMLDNKIDAFSKTFLGLTVSCARCHDHKLDAVYQREYYALGGAFMSSRWVSNTVDLPERHVPFVQQLRELKRQLKPLLAKQWSSDLESLSAAAMQERRPAPGDKEPPLEDLWAIWSALVAETNKEKSTTAIWMELAEKYRTERESRLKQNREHFQAVADFRDGLPAGWSLDGVGVREVTPRGDFTVALAGDAAVGQILPGGLFTFADSPRLNGALRTPILNTLEPGHLSFEVCGGDFAAQRGVIDNAFLTEKQTYLKSRHVTWQRVDTFGGMRQRQNYVEFATKTSNPNFPPRWGLGDQLTQEQMDDPRSGWGITRVVRHQAPFSPTDELTLMHRLFQGETPQTLAEAANKFAAEGRKTIERWLAGTPDDADIQLLNWLLDHRLLTNRRTSPELEPLVARYRQVEQQLPDPWTVNGMKDADPGYNLKWLYRGEYDQFRDPVPRGYIQALGGSADGYSAHHSGRLPLALDIASPHNPLTSRVFVNRVWHWLFGTGLSATPSDFGHAGDTPSHPELLDDFTQEFLAHGWSLKSAVRQIVSTQSFRQASETTAEALAADPANRWLHHYPLRRLEAEAIRDALLVTSGRFDAALYGAPVNPYRQNEDAMKRLFCGPLDGLGRRSLYTKVTIMEPPKFLAIFNQPAPKIPTGIRDLTNTPAQALTLLNDPLVKQQAEYWAGQLVQGTESQPPLRIELMFRTALGRTPTAEELETWTAAAREFAQLRGVAPSDLMTSHPVWTDLAHALFNTKEFLYGL